MKKPIEHDIRYTQLTDEKFLLECLNDKTIKQWFPVQSDDEVRLFIKNWVGFHKFRSSLTVTIKDQPCAIGTLFLLPYKKICHQCFFYLVVGKKYQNLGIGTSLIKNLINLSKNFFKHEQIYAEIFEGCKIEKVLKAFNFQKFAEQKGFVLQDTIYKKRLCYQLSY